MHATLAGNLVSWKEPKTLHGKICRWGWVLVALLVAIPLTLTMLRELFAQSWGAAAGPFDHISIYGVMAYGDSLLVAMLVCIGWFETILWRRGLYALLPRMLRSWQWWIMLVPYFLVGQQLLNLINEPRHGPIVYRQAWIFDLYHDLVAGLVLHQLTAFVYMLLTLSRRRRFCRQLVVSGVVASLLLTMYVGIWIEQPPKRVIRNGISIDTSEYGGEWIVPKLYTAEE